MGSGPTDNTEHLQSSAICTTKATTATGVLGDRSTSSVHGIQLLAEEMLSTLQHNIDTVKKTAGPSECQSLYNGWDMMEAKDMHVQNWLQLHDCIHVD